MEKRRIKLSAAIDGDLLHYATRALAQRICSHGEAAITMQSACEEPINSLGLYLRDVRERKHTDLADVGTLLAQATCGAPIDATDAREQLTIMYQPLVIGLAKRFAGQCEILDMLDLIQEGNLALLEAISRYVAEHTETTFGVWARAWIKGAMRSAVSRLDKQMPVPSRKLRDLQRLEAEEFNFRAAHDRMPSVKELATLLGMAPATVLDLVAIRSRTIRDLDGIDWSSCKTVSEPEAMADPMHDVLHTALNSLSARQRAVINLRFGFADGVEHNHQAIADILGISRSTVQQAEQAALVRLRHTLKVVKQVHTPIAA